MNAFEEISARRRGEGFPNVSLKIAPATQSFVLLIAHMSPWSYVRGDCKVQTQKSELQQSELNVSHVFAVLHSGSISSDFRKPYFNHVLLE